MNRRTLVSLCVAGAVLVSVAGCKKSEPSVEGAQSEVKSTTQKTVDAVKDAAADAKAGTEKVATEVKEGAVQAATDVKESVQNAAAAVKDKAVELTTPAPAADPADGIIAKAKALVGEAKYQAALEELNSLKGMTLSDAQKKLVDDLTAQIQKGLNSAAASGASAVGNLLK